MITRVKGKDAIPDTPPEGKGMYEEGLSEKSAKGEHMEFAAWDFALCHIVVTCPQEAMGANRIGDLFAEGMKD